MDGTQNQNDVHKMITALESVLQDIETSKTHIDESLRIIKHKTATAHAALQQNEASIQAGKVAASQRLQALVEKAKQ